MKKNLALATFVVISMLVAVEFIGAYFLGGNFTPRFLYFNQEPWLFRKTFVSYPPNRAIRTAAVYGDAIEFDVSFDTNDEGFIDDVDYGPIEKSGLPTVAIVGDSFAAGFHGGDPWVRKIRQADWFDAARFEILNFGVEGVGVENFANIILSYQDRLNIRTILFIVISDDFTRYLWKPLYVDKRIFFCPAFGDREECTDVTRILIRDEESFLENLGASNYARCYQSWFRKYLNCTFLGNLLKTAKTRARQLPAAMPSLFGTFAKTPNVKPIVDIAKARDAGSVIVLHLPEKREVLSGQKTDLGVLFRDTPVRYVNGFTACALTASDYFARDSHPNAVGYEKIRACTEKLLGANDALFAGDEAAPSQPTIQGTTEPEAPATLTR